MGKGRPISYEAYVAKYRAEEEKLKLENRKMYAPMYTEAKFLGAYKGMQNSLKERGMNTTNIPARLVRKQTYEVSYNEARALAHAREVLGMPKLKLKEIIALGREAALDDWDQVKAKYKEFKGMIDAGEGMGFLTAQAMINHFIFGSD